MKTKLPHLLALFTGASLLLIAPAGLRAQAIPLPPGYPTVDPTTGLPIQPPKPEPIRFSDTIEKKRVETKFDGVPLTEVVTWMEETFPEVNVVLPQSLLELNPPVLLRLRAAGLHDILEALNIATDGVVEAEMRSPTLVALRPQAARGPARPAFIGQTPSGPGTELPQFTPDMAKLFRQRYGMDMSAPASEPPPPSYQVINLREILRIKDEAKIRETLEVVQKITARTLDIMAADSREPRRRQPIKSFEYHEGSGVLVIIGQPDAIKVAMDVLRNVRMQDSSGGGKTGGAEPTEPQPTPRASTGDAK